jgi:poly(A) polymerase
MAMPPPDPNNRPLEAAPWLKSPALARVFAALDPEGGKVRVIGGAVRNTLMGIPVTDIDLATELVPEAVIARATKAGLVVHPTGLDHGTVTVVADGHPFEVTTLRRDVETDGRRAVVAFTRDWHEDALRRDFTINALSCDAGGTIYDTVGGLEDIEARRVRFIGKAEDRIREDYLRILRFFRFTAAYGEGAPDARGLAACLALKDGMARLSAERIGAEIMKFIVTSRACEIADIMESGGIFESITGHAAVPDALLRLQGIERALGEAPDAIARLAVLLVRSADEARALAQRLRLSNAESSALAAVADGNLTGTPETTEEAAKAQFYRLGAEAYSRAIRADWARCGAPTTDPAWRVKSLLATRWSPPRMPFSGADVLALGIPAGPRVGRALRAFEAWWIEAGFPDDRTAQCARLAALAEQS